MTTEPTDDELAKLFTEETGFDVDDFPAAILDFARAARQRWGAAEHYRNAIASACEGWTMPDGLRNHLETALWSPPTPQPIQTVPPAEREPLTEVQIERAAKKLAECMDYPWGHMPTIGREEMRIHARAVLEAALGLKGGQHGESV